MKNPQSMSDDEIAAELKSLAHARRRLGSGVDVEAIRFLADRERTLLDEQDDRIPEEPPGEEFGKTLTAFAGTVVTVSVKCALCNERLSARGVAGEKLDAELEHFRRAEGWLRLPMRETNPVRPHPVDVCKVCQGEIATTTHSAAVFSEGR